MISPVANRVPGKPISVFNNDLKNLIYSSNFILYLNCYEYSVKEISGIDIDYKYESIECGGSEYSIFAHDYKNKDFIRINIKRAMPKKKSELASKAIQLALAAAAKMVGGVAQTLARKAAMLAAASLDPIASLEKGPAAGMIQVFSRDFSEIVAGYSFLSLGAEKWTMSPDLDASSGDVVYESIDLICQGLTRMTVDWSSGPSGLWNVLSSDYSQYDESEMESLEELRNASLEHVEKVKQKQEEKKSKSSIDKQIEKLKEQYKELDKTYGEVVAENREKKDEKYKKAEDEKAKQKTAFRKEIEERNKKRKEEAAKIKEKNEKLTKKREKHQADVKKALKESQKQAKENDENL